LQRNAKNFQGEERMKNVFMAAIVVFGVGSVVNAHEPNHNATHAHTVWRASCLCDACCCKPHIVTKHYVGRGVWNYSKGVGARAFDGIVTFVTAPFSEPVIIPQKQYLVTPGYYSYHPGSVREIVPQVHHHQQ
jgi:hypothetical protein